ncbi:SDR family NAD(P)-dependent oxidoreductase [Rhodovulum sp. DZ06]|uniref:SDR family NAD(P)-dependent oxidoreductase n=1 Tax=Rhodovulum sp. DZ06 TaxID=3425126 RepID=UPI003D33C044
MTDAAAAPAAAPLNAPLTAVVTGAARGIGLASAATFLGEGRRVALVDRDADALAEAAAALRARGFDGAVPIIADVSDPAQVARMTAEALAALGRVDALVNNAGVADFGPIEQTGFDRWRRVMETNLDGVFLCTQAMTPHLKAAKGCIVNIASISGLRASTLRVAYGTSKAAVIQLTQQQAVELGEFGIRANCVAPGPVRTKLAMAVHTQDIIDAYHDAIPLNRYGSEQELANVICFLCSDKASYVTGQTLAVDGGFEATGVGLPALRK